MPHLCRTAIKTGERQRQQFFVRHTVQPRLVARFRDDFYSNWTFIRGNAPHCRRFKGKTVFIMLDARAALESPTAE